MSAGPKVLVVDDDRDVREAIVEFLQTKGFDVVEAANGLEALVQVRRSRPASVVLDLMMPRLGGLDAIKRIRAFDRHVKIVVITGSPDPELGQRAMALGAVAVLAKPLDLSDLLPALRAEMPRPTEASIAAQTPLPAVPRVATGPSATKQILVVLGEPELRVRLGELLTAAGYQVRLTSDAASGVRAVLDTPPDIVLLDVEMPGLGGLGVLPTIIALVPDAKVIMLHERANAELAERSLAFGAFDCVVKPIDSSSLVQTIEAARARQIDLGE